MTSTIKIKNSSTAGAVPGSGDLVQGELAVNVTDKKIYTKNASGTIVNLGTTPSITDNGNAEAIVIDSSENVGIGVTPSAWYSGAKAIEIGNKGNAIYSPGANEVDINQNVYLDASGNYIYARTALATQYTLFNGQHRWFTAPSGTAGNAITFTQAMTLDASGNLLVAGTTANSWTSNGSVTIGAGSGAMGYNANIGTGTGGLYFMTATSGGGRHAGTVGYDGTSNYMWFETSSTERARIDSSGNLLVGRTDAAAGNVGGKIASTGFIEAVVNADACISANRKTDDGVLVLLQQQNTTEGTISVSGTTVSYNGGHLARFAQTVGAKDESLLKGTVLSNLDEMNTYVNDEGETVANEQLNKVKVSDVEGDANVAGVFVNWSHDEQHNVDEINMAMTGDMIIRIAQGTTVARGDLLMSAGNGTAKPQGDDIVRAKTIAKVTSTHVTYTYGDGSYCVPCVLMAC